MKFLKFFAFALLAIGVQGDSTCNPQQGQTYEYDFNLAGFQTGCGSTIVTITSGVEHFKSSWNYIQNSNGGYTYCGKSHYETPNAKAIDSDGTVYNLIEVGNSDYENSSDYSTFTFDGQYSIISIFKLIGRGKAANSQIKLNVDCSYHYDPNNGYTSSCTRDNYKIECN